MIEIKMCTTNNSTIVELKTIFLRIKLLFYKYSIVHLIFTFLAGSAFILNPDLKKVTIRENVDIGDAAFGFNRDDNTSREVYESNGKAEVTYIFVDGNWIKI